MALSQSLQQKLLQKLSPQQIQLMKLLQVPTAHLEERIKEELEEPGGTRQCREQVIACQRSFFINIITEGLVTDVQQQAPEQIGGKASPE